MIFQNNFEKNHKANPVKQRGSRECIKNAFAKKHLAAKRIARHSCRAWIETINHSDEELEYLADRPAFMPGVD